MPTMKLRILIVIISDISLVITLTENFDCYNIRYKFSHNTHRVLPLHGSLHAYQKT